MSHFGLQSIFPLSSQSFVVLSYIAQLHSSLFFRINPLVEHIGLFVLLFLIHTHSVHKHWVLWLQFVRNFFDCLILFGLFGLFSEPTHIRYPWLFFSRILDRRNSLPIHWWLCAFDRRWHAFLSFKWLFRLFFLGFFILGRDRIEHSGWPLVLLILCKGGNVDGLSFILCQSFPRVIEFRVKGPRMATIRFHNPFNKVEGNVEFLLDLLNPFLFRQPHDISIKLAHFVSHIALTRPLLHQPRLLLEPSIQIFQGHSLVLP